LEWVVIILIALEIVIALFFHWKIIKLLILNI
jgi:hypothetical protein